MIGKGKNFKTLADLTDRQRNQIQERRIGRNWFKYNLDHCSVLPPLPCVYVVYADNQIIYIGSTTNLFKRFGTGGHKVIMIKARQGKKLIQLHQTIWGEFESLFIKVRFSDFIGDWAQKEIYFIHRIQPRNNVTYNLKTHG
jgi:hypothetical protein